MQPIPLFPDWDFLGCQVIDIPVGGTGTATKTPSPDQKWVILAGCMHHLTKTASSVYVQGPEMIAQYIMTITSDVASGNYCLGGTIIIPTPTGYLSSANPPIMIDAKDVLGVNGDATAHFTAQIAVYQKKKKGFFG